MALHTAFATVGVVGAMLIPALHTTPAAAGAGEAAADPSITIVTDSAVAYGDPYDSDLDGFPDYVFRPRFETEVALRCPEGEKAYVFYEPVTAHQIPVSPDFTCSGRVDTVKVSPASYGEVGDVQVTARLFLRNGNQATEVAATTKNVYVYDNQMAWALLKAPAEVTKGKGMTLRATIELFSYGRWEPMNAHVAVQSLSDSGSETVGRDTSGKDGKFSFDVPAVNKTGDWRLTWSYGGRRWYSTTERVKVTEPAPSLPNAPEFWAGTVTTNTAAMHWKPPANGKNITGYRFGWTSSNGLPVPSWQGDWPAGATSPITMINLNPGTTYQMWVAALTPDGAGKRASVSVTTKVDPTPDPNPGPQPPPDAVTAPSKVRNADAKPRNRKVRLYWTEPRRDGGSRVDWYRVRDVKNRTTYKVPASKTTKVVKGLRNGKRYVFTIRAHNDVGYGPAVRVAARPRR